MRKAAPVTVHTKLGDYQATLVVNTPEIRMHQYMDQPRPLFVIRPTTMLLDTTGLPKCVSLRRHVSITMMGPKGKPVQGKLNNVKRQCPGYYALKSYSIVVEAPGELDDEHK